MFAAVRNTLSAGVRASRFGQFRPAMVGFSTEVELSPEEIKTREHPQVQVLLKELMDRRSKASFTQVPTNNDNPQVFFDLKVGDKEVGRVQMEVYTNEAPKAGENFRSLVTGAKGKSYNNTKFFSWFGNAYVNGGDVISNDGTQGESIYGPTFKGEMTDLPMGYGSVHLLPSKPNDPRASIGHRDEVDSRFSIMVMDLPSVMTGMGVCVAQVLEGIEHIERITGLPVDKENNFKPKVEVEIINCGEVSEDKKIVKPVKAASH